MSLAHRRQGLLHRREEPATMILKLGLALYHIRSRWARFDSERGDGALSSNAKVTEGLGFKLLTFSESHLTISDAVILRINNISHFIIDD